MTTQPHTHQPQTPETHQPTEPMVPLVIEGVPDVVACEVGLAGCDGAGALSAWSREADPRRCCEPCGTHLVTLPGVMVFPVIR